MPSEQGGRVGIDRGEMPAGLVASGSDKAVGDLPFERSDREPGLDFAQQIDYVTDQDAVLGRGLDQAAPVADQDAQQVEKADQRDISGHDDADRFVGRPAGGRVSGEP